VRKSFTPTQIDGECGSGSMVAEAMKKTRRFAVVLAMLAAVGCAGTPFDWGAARQVKIGMTEQEVEAIMGAPYLIKSAPEGTTWIWSYANLATQVRTYSITFKGGKVVAIPSLPESYK